MCPQVTLFEYGHLVALDTCINGIKCETGGLKYNVYEDPLCSGTALTSAASVSCPTSNPQCYGGKVGVSSSSSVAATGPCLPEPRCTAAGIFPATDGASKIGKYSFHQILAKKNTSYFRGFFPLL